MKPKCFCIDYFVVEDKLSIAHGLETQIPCLDNDFVNFALQAPVKYKLSNFAFEKVNENDIFSKLEKRVNGKRILPKIMSCYFPDNIAHTPKQGFSALMPVGSKEKVSNLYARCLVIEMLKFSNYLIIQS